ncbi:magnesium chelatase subunit D [Methylobacterium sp. sgz302541]|uniref:magnesium chelatase subunit D n=1 Tax=unclassified Methylobacterium TaxID=2615210 RepID=UPI003D34D27A
MSDAPGPNDGRAAWADALAAASLVAADPHGTGGVWLKAAAGPVRDAWLAALRTMLAPSAPLRRMPPAIADDRLLGGLDLPATLAAGRPVAQKGLLAEADGGLVLVPMAERLPAGTAARLAAALDSGLVRAEREGLATLAPARIGLILLDEGIDDERAPAALAERLAFHVDLTGLGLADIAADAPTGAPAPAPRKSKEPTADPEEEGDPPFDAASCLCETAAALGIGSLRGPLLALRTARLIAARDGRSSIGEDDAVAAACLVLAPRATRLPPSDHEREAPAPEEERERPPDGDGAGEQSRPPEDRVLDAARAAIPPGLLALIAAGGPAPRTARTGKAGLAAPAARSGRPASTRPGDPRRERLDLVATLRAAAPWQRLRRAERPEAPARVLVRPGDVRVRRHRQPTQTTTIFVVDASGSAATERLAEAKGAVELLLAEAYVRRDRVALIAFRGTGAELVLPPTRSLARARRCLAGMPGGGGTPLAAGLDAGVALALSVRRGGGVPAIVLLTDGRANIARSGEPGRARAGEDALAAGRLLRAADLGAILVDTAPRPQDTARRLAEAMAARYLPLPHADAGMLSLAVTHAARTTTAA